MIKKFITSEFGSFIFSWLFAALFTLILWRSSLNHYEQILESQRIQRHAPLPGSLVSPEYARRMLIQQHVVNEPPDEKRLSGWRIQDAAPPHFIWVLPSPVTNQIIIFTNRIHAAGTSSYDTNSLLWQSTSNHIQNPLMRGLQHLLWQRGYGITESESEAMRLMRDTNAVEDIANWHPKLLTNTMAVPRPVGIGISKEW